MRIVRQCLWTFVLSKIWQLPFQMKMTLENRFSQSFSETIRFQINPQSIFPCILYVPLLWIKMTDKINTRTNNRFFSVLCVGNIFYPFPWNAHAHLFCQIDRQKPKFQIRQSCFLVYFNCPFFFLLLFLNAITHICHPKDQNII